MSSLCQKSVDWALRKELHEKSSQMWKSSSHLLMRQVRACAKSNRCLGGERHRRQWLHFYGINIKSERLNFRNCACYRFRSKRRKQNSCVDRRRRASVIHHRRNSRPLVSVQREYLRWRSGKEACKRRCFLLHGVLRGPVSTGSHCALVSNDKKLKWNR